MFILLKWLISTVSLVLVAYIVPGIQVSNFYAALVAALFLGIVNAIVRPILIFLTLPINILTLGFFTLVINGLMFLIVASFVKGFDVAGFWPAFWAALIYWIIAWFTNILIEK